MSTRLFASPDSGFTIAELMIVVVILGILVFLAVATYHVSTGKATATVCRHNQRVVQDAVYSYQISKSSLPTSLTAVAPFVKSSLSPDICPADDSVRYDYDSTTGLVTCSLHP